MVLSDPNEIDMVSIDRNQQRVRLAILIPGAFPQRPVELVQLAHKVNGYVNFVKTGQLEARYPETDGLQAWIEIAHSDIIPRKSAMTVQQLAAQVSRLGIGVSTRLVDQ